MLTQANALRIPLADESVHCVVTSPPYWGLRDYGLGDQLGLEPTPEQYVANMVAVFREVKRVLRADGTCWVNLGSSYNGSGGAGGDYNEGGLKEGQPKYSGRNVSTFKPKDLVPIPWMVAMALQADGWWLRSDIIWSKKNPMPESVTDRPTKSHEYLFLMTKSAKYFYDADAVREPQEQSTIDRVKYARNQWKYKKDITDSHVAPQPGPNRIEPNGRNRRTVWHIATAPYSGAHFATYPPALVEPCIKAGTSERGVCPECGAPWERVTEKERDSLRPISRPVGDSRGKSASDFRALGQPQQGCQIVHTTTLGWRPTCSHDHEPVSAVVFDPFAGSGTTLQVARALGRNGVGLDLSLEYLHLARTRLSLDALEAWGKAKKDGASVTDLPMFGGQDEN